MKNKRIEEYKAEVNKLKKETNIIKNKKRISKPEKYELMIKGVRISLLNRALLYEREIREIDKEEKE